MAARAHSCATAPFTAHTTAAYRYTARRTRPSRRTWRTTSRATATAPHSMVKVPPWQCPSLALHFLGVCLVALGSSTLPRARPDPWNPHCARATATAKDAHFTAFDHPDLEVPRSIVKVPPWQCPSLAPVLPRCVPGGSGQLDTPKGEARSLESSLQMASNSIRTASRRTT